MKGGYELTLNPTPNPYLYPLLFKRVALLLHGDKGGGEQSRIASSDAFRDNTPGAPLASWRRRCLCAGAGGRWSARNQESGAFSVWDKSGERAHHDPHRDDTVGGPLASWRRRCLCAGASERWSEETQGRGAFSIRHTGGWKQARIASDPHRDKTGGVTRIVAPNVFVRGRRWAMERKNSSEWRFFYTAHGRVETVSDSQRRLLGLGLNPILVIPISCKGQYRRRGRTWSG